jgi:hypothetical protein
MPTIGLLPTASAVLDLAVPGLLVTNGAGNPVRAQQFFEGGRTLARPTHRRRSPAVVIVGTTTVGSHFTWPPSRT